jgi:glycine dehydrogenase subunit 1
MPFIPHTEQDVFDMLAAIGESSLESLFDEIPTALRTSQPPALPPPLSEMEIDRLMRTRSRTDGQPLCFIGAGAYEHYIPAAVWQLVARGEFYTAYTPYQAEASQGTLQIIYEFQSMMTALTALAVSNASLYDGASALAEAVLMAIRINRRHPTRRVLMPRSVHPAYRQVTQTIVRYQNIEIVEVPFDPQGGHITLDALTEACAEQACAAVIIPQPNFFGILEDVDAITDWAHQQNAIVIGLVNPLALALLAPPGEWGTQGADIACGEAQPFGIPLASGGPYLGFLCTRQDFVRQLPGRIVGKTLDAQGQIGYTLTLQAREQHIRRSKATSNICTNQGLLVTAATIYMALLGTTGLERVAAACHANTQKLIRYLCNLPGITPLFDRPVFHECPLRLPISTQQVLQHLATHHILGGFNIESAYPELAPALLVCATECRTDDDMERFKTLMARAIATRP